MSKNFNMSFLPILLQVCPSAASVMDADKYLPLHQCLDCAEPNYSLALQILNLHPQAASIVTKEEMLPLHLIVGTNSDPTHEHAHSSGNEGSNEAIEFVKALLQAYPQALVTTVRDIVPAMDGVALADPESWSGEWVESYWSPLTRARDRGLNGLVQLFLSFQQQQEKVKEDARKPAAPVYAPQIAVTHVRGTGGSGSPRASSTAALPPISSHQQQQPVIEGRPSPVVPLLGLPGSPSITQQKSARGREQGNGSPISEIIPFHQDFRSNNNNNNSAVPVKSQPLNNNNNNNYSGVNPIRASHVGSGDNYDPAVDEDLPAIGTNRSSNRSSRVGRAAPGSRVPPHILKAQNAARASSAGGSQSGDSRASSTERDRERQQRVQQQQYLQQQYQRQQQQQRQHQPQSAWGGNRSTDGSDFGGNGRELMTESMDLQSYHTQHTAAVDRNRPRDTTPVRQGMRDLAEGSANSAKSNNNNNNNSNNKAPPPGPIPASLLEAAENNAQRLARAQLESQTPAGVRKARALGNSGSPVKEKSPYKTSKRNPNNNKNDLDTVDVAPPARLAATVGASVTRQQDTEESEFDNYEKLRVGTAPVYTDRNKFTQPRVVGFGSNSAWSNGEDTAEDSTVAPAPEPVVAHHSSEGHLFPTTTNPNNNNNNNAALTTKQQRLLQAQQSYMKRSAAAGAAKPSNINVISGPNGGTGSNNSSTNSLLPVGLKAKPGMEDVSGGPISLKPITAAGGFTTRAAPSNHTSEVMKNLAAGKIRIHPVKAQTNAGTGAMDSRADEMV